MTEQDVPTKKTALQLFSIGFLTLYLELALIRYLSGNIWNLGYFPNLVLLAAFMGMGIGFVFYHFFSEERGRVLFLTAPMVLFFLLAFIYAYGPTLPGFDRLSGEIGGEIYFTQTVHRSSTWSYFSFFVWFCSIVICFALISQRTARLFQLFSPLKAYTLDITGSCCGILCFMMLSWTEAPAWVWLCLLIPMFFFVQSRWTLKGNVFLGGALLLVVFVGYLQDTEPPTKFAQEASFRVHWSPYQKLELIQQKKKNKNIWIFANGIAHQVMLPVHRLAKSKLYQTPYENLAQNKNRKPPKSVLIIGAGSGNDVAVALAKGAEKVVALEIDPILARLGKEFHPAKPYSNPKVRLVVGDARTFLNNTKEKYDLIIFALTDSLVKVSAMAQLRLENFVYTVDSVKKAFKRLSPDGELVLYNAYRRLWIMQKLYWTLVEAVGREPRAYHCETQSCFLHVGLKDPIKKDSKTPIHLSAAPGTSTVTLENISRKDLRTILPSDDWPFLYLFQRGIPTIYIFALLTLILLVTALLLLHSRLNTSAQELKTKGLLPIKLAFLVMGTAFLLLETKSIIQFSLLFGTTWYNTSLVFLAILTLVLLANWIASLLPKSSLLVAYILLIIFCLVPLAYPLSNLLEFDNKWLRFLLASLLTFSPIFFANLIFSLTFRDQKVAAHLFGWNLLGATLGGIIEYSSMLFGYSVLAVIVALCYTSVFLLIYFGQKGQETSGAAA